MPATADRRPGLASAWRTQVGEGSGPRIRKRRQMRRFPRLRGRRRPVRGVARRGRECRRVRCGAAAGTGTAATGRRRALQTGGEVPGEAADPPGSAMRVSNAALSELEAENLMPLPLQPDALLGHAEKLSYASGTQHLGVGKQTFFHGRPARTRGGQRLGQSVVLAPRSPDPVVLLPDDCRGDRPTITLRHALCVTWGEGDTCRPHVSKPRSGKCTRHSVELADRKSAWAQPTRSLRRACGAGFGPLTSGGGEGGLVSAAMVHSYSPIWPI